MKTLRNSFLYFAGILIAITLGYLQTKQPTINPMLIFGMFLFVGVASFGAYLQTTNQ
jgi:hypothetical protein